MKTTLLYLINTSALLLTCFPLQAQEYINGDTLYVWVKSGLNLRSAPNIEAAVIQTIPYGQPVEIITRGDILDKPYRVKIIDAVKFNDDFCILNLKIQTFNHGKRSRDISIGQTKSVV